MRDQRRGENQRPDLLSAPEAAALLGIKLPTLYAYVSRGLLESLPGEGHARCYARADVLRLRARAAARAGHGPVAAGALHWGEPVLESALTAVDGGGPRYRGHAAVALARRGVCFEAVAELLWCGALPAVAPRWAAARALAPGRVAPLVSGADAVAALMVLVPALGAADPGRYAAPSEAELDRARGLQLQLAAGLALARGDSARFSAALRAAEQESGVARAAAVALQAPESDEAVRALDQALVLTADHELNVSTFAARVAASAGADLYACVAAALSTLSGSRHGGACDRVEALVAEVARAPEAAAVVRDRLRRGESLPGFGHRLYPEGDPRTPPLLEAAQALGPRRQALRHLLALVSAMRATGHPPPSVETGLVALTLALGLPPGSAAGLFAVGRCAGWVAHALEQRASPLVLRPRARYIGPAPAP